MQQQLITEEVSVLRKGKTPMANREDYVLVLDTETAGKLEFPLVYDLAWIIYNKNGEKVLSRGFLINEIFKDTTLMDTAFYKEKIPLYKARKVSRKYANFNDALEVLKADMRAFGITEIFAYNSNFDCRAIHSTRTHLLRKNTAYTKCNNIDISITELYKQDTHFKTEFKHSCIWTLAINTIGQTSEYREFCRLNNFLTQKQGHFTSNAEVMFLYINQQLLGIFTESHTALEDCTIEAEIYFYILNHFNMGKKLKKQLLTATNVIHKMKI